MPQAPSSRYRAAPVTLCALLLGRIQAGIARAAGASLKVLAARLVRESLVAALRQEGHEFTPERFFVWYAGLDTLSDRPQSTLRSPRALCQTLLIELRHSPWAVMADTAEVLEKAFLAPSDFNRGEDHKDAHMAVQDARELLDSLGHDDDALPFGAVARLFAAAARSPRFARRERDLTLLGGRAIERQAAENERWALDVLAGSYLVHHGLPVALPLPGFVTLPLAMIDRSDVEGAEEDAAIAALHEMLWRIDQWLGEAERDWGAIAGRLKDRRSSGRADALAFLLAGFGSLRGTQIERMLGVSRPGVAVIVTALERSGLTVSEASRNATRLHVYAPHQTARSDDEEAVTDALPSGTGPSAEALAEYEAAMDAIDALLKRSSSDRD